MAAFYEANFVGVASDLEAIGSLLRSWLVPYPKDGLMRGHRKWEMEASGVMTSDTFLDLHTDPEIEPEPHWIRAARLRGWTPPEPVLPALSFAGDCTAYWDRRIGRCIVPIFEVAEHVSGLWPDVMVVIVIGDYHCPDLPSCHEVWKGGKRGTLSKQEKWKFFMPDSVFETEGEADEEEERTHHIDDQDLNLPSFEEQLDSRNQEKEKP